MTSAVPVVSVITTAYNAGKYLSAAIASIVGQRFGDWEHIIVDDGSTDDTAAIVRAVADPRVILVEAGRIGRGPALNLGLARARGAYIAIQDADDVSRPERLSVELALLEAHSEFAGLGSGQILIEDDAVPVWPGLGSAPTVAAVARHLPFYNPLSHTSVMVRRTALSAIGGYDTSRSMLFDWDLYVRLAAARQPLGKISAPLVAKRVHRKQFFEAGHSWTYAWRQLEIQWRALPASGYSRWRAMAFPVLLGYRWLPRSFRMFVRRQAYRVREQRAAKE